MIVFTSVLVLLTLLSVSLLTRHNAVKFPYNVLGSVLNDNKILDHSQLIDSKYEDGIDPYVSVVLKLSPGKVGSLIRLNILTTCKEDRSNCSQPLWMKISEFKQKYEIGIPYLGSSSSTDSIYCTSAWDDVVNGIAVDRDTICVDIQNDLLGYEFFTT